MSGFSSVYWLNRVVQYVFEKKMKVLDEVGKHSGVKVKQHISQRSRGLVNDVHSSRFHSCLIRLLYRKNSAV